MISIIRRYQKEKIFFGPVAPFRTVLGVHPGVQKLLDTYFHDPEYKSIPKMKKTNLGRLLKDTRTEKKIWSGGPYLDHFGDPKFFGSVTSICIRTLPNPKKIRRTHIFIILIRCQNLGFGIESGL